MNQYMTTQTKFPKKLDRGIILLLRQRKQEGFSLSEIAHEFNIGKSTASLYCRDLFSHPMRKHQTERDARRQITINKSKRWHKGKRSPSDLNKDRARNHLPCIKCGQPRKSDSINKLCYACYKQKRIDDAYTHKQEIQKKREKIWQAEKESKERDRQNKQRLYKPIPIEICNKSPNKRHYWIIDSNNIGTCKWCSLIRDYKKLQPNFNKSFGTI